MKSYVVNFIRHGLTQANIKGQYAGISDIPVCEEGVKKLENLRDSYEYPKVDAYFSSPLIRCRQTCNIIYPQAEPTIVEDLKECNFGDWEMKTPSELENNPDYKEWLKSGQRLKPPGGESGEEFENRIKKAVESLVDGLVRSGTTSAAVFAHGGVIMRIISYYGIPKMDPFEYIVDNGCGYSVRITPSLWMRNQVFEICHKLPVGYDGKISGKFKDLIDSQKNVLK